MQASPHLLRPAKIRSAARRRWFERRAPSLQMRHPTGGVDLVGSPYGGWVMPVGLIGRGWLCYSAGAGGDISFDLELIRRFEATVRSFDPVAAFVDAALEQAGGEPRLTAHQAAVAVADGPVRMQISHDPGSRSVSSAGLYDSQEWVTLPGRTIPSLMAELGDDHVDLLKLDIEGAEYDVLPTLDLDAMGVSILGVQLHHVGSVTSARGIVAMLAQHGFEPIARRPAVRLVFARRELVDAARERAQSSGRGT